MTNYPIISYPIISVNGQLTDKVSVLDRGFAYGDGVFETCKLLNGKIVFWNLHRERLFLACKKLQISLDLNYLDSQIIEFFAQIPSQLLLNAIFKLTVTRGQGGRGYATTGILSPNYVLALFPAPQYPSENATKGVSVKICDQRLSCNPTLAGLKHLNRLEQILARAEWSDPSIAEGILLDTQDHVIEATSSNLFFVRNTRLLTPDVSMSGISGVVRRFIIESLAPQLGLQTEITTISLEELLSADEIFLCNSAFGIWSVRHIVTPFDKYFSVGPISLQLQKALTESEAKND